MGDCDYGNGLVRAELAEHEVEVLAPVPEGRIEDVILGKHEFEIDLDAGIVRCPAGHVVPVSVSKTGFRQASFPSTSAAGVRSSCPGKSRRQLRLIEHEELLQAGRRALQDPVAGEHLRRTRPRIEASSACSRTATAPAGAATSAAQKVQLKAAWAGALVNLNPISRYVAAHKA